MQYRNLPLKNYIKAIKWRINDEISILQQSTLPAGTFGWIRLSGLVTGCNPEDYDEYAPYQVQTRKVFARVKLLNDSLIEGYVIGLVRREDATCVITGGNYPYPQSEVDNYHNDIEDWLEDNNHPKTLVTSLYNLRKQN